MLGNMQWCFLNHLDFGKHLGQRSGKLSGVILRKFNSSHAVTFEHCFSLKCLVLMKVVTLTTVKLAV